MCGIVGYLGRRPAMSFLVEGLKRLEYRGYDSAGVAIRNGNAFEVCRELIETVKTDLPIWKRQVDATGRSAWKGLGEDQPPANGGSTSAVTA